MTASHSIPTGPIPPGQAVPVMRPVSALQGAALEAAIGRLVRETLQHQLGLAAAAARPLAEPLEEPLAGRPAQFAANASQRIGEAVVSLRVLEALPEGTARVEIGARAVLTPAAADLLRQRGIAVVRGSQHEGRQPAGSLASAEGVPATQLCGWIADADHPERATGYVRQLAGRGLSAAGIELPLPSAQGSSTALGPAAMGVVIAELPAIHVDHFARQLSLPAAAVGSLSEVARIAAAMSPTVWVLDAERLSFSGRVAVAAECFRLSQADSAERRRPR